MSYFNYILENIIQKMFSCRVTIIIEDFNINFLNKTKQSSTLQTLMKKYNFQLIFLKSTNINDTQINHI